MSIDTTRDTVERTLRMAVTNRHITPAIERLALAILARAEDAEDFRQTMDELMTLAEDTAAERDALKAEDARLREALGPFAFAIKAARQRLGEHPDINDVTALACRFIAYEHFKAALSETAQGEPTT